MGGESIARCLCDLRAQIGLPAEVQGGAYARCRAVNGHYVVRKALARSLREAGAMSR
jgi:hypothetical protein